MKKNNPFFYALILLAITLVSQMFTNYNYSYFVDDMSLITLRQASFAKIIFLFFDGLNDVIFGFLSDKLKHKNIKRKTWIGFTMPLFCSALVLTYALDNTMKFSNSQFLLYYIGITVLFDVFSSIMSVNFNSLFPTLYKDQTERTKVSSLTHIFEIAGIGVIFLLVPIIKDKIGFLNTSLIISILVIILLTISLINIEEKDKDTLLEKEKPSFIQTLKDVIKNKPFVYYVITSCSFQTILGTLVTILPFLVKYTLRITPVQQSILTIVASVIILLSMKIWSYLIQKNGVENVFKFSFIIFPIIVFTLGCSFNFVSALIFIILCCPFIGSFLILPDLVMANIIDEDKKRYHQSREGTLLSIASFTRRIALLVAAVILMIASSLFGYIDGENPGDNPSLCFKIISVVFLPLVAIIGSIASRFYIKAISK